MTDIELKNTTSVLEVNEQTTEDAATTTVVDTPVISTSDQVQVYIETSNTPEDETKFVRRSPPIQLEWHNLEYRVKVKPSVPSTLMTGKERMKFTFKNMFKKVEKPILHPMTGFVAPGSVLAIMGPSGAGKTSLCRFKSIVSY